ncbi:hypothetical protein V8C26DRAFT_426521 [Trichoderma gracile]
MAPHALLAPGNGGLVFPWGAVPLDDNDENHPKAKSYVVAATIVAVFLAICLAVGTFGAFVCCIKRRRRIRREAVRNRPPTPIARGRVSSDDDEEAAAQHPIPLATLPPAAKIAGRRPPAGIAAHRAGFLSGMDVARPLQVPFLDTVVEATSSEERVSQRAGDGRREEADGGLGEDAARRSDEVESRRGV